MELIFLTTLVIVSLLLKKKNTKQTYCSPEWPLKSTDLNLTEFFCRLGEKGTQRNYYQY